jgi:hypothetical protein
MKNTLRQRRRRGEDREFRPEEIEIARALAAQASLYVYRRQDTDI